MSGGVDSSVAAFLLKKAGFRVEGAFIKFWFWKKHKNYNQELEKKVRKIANELEIPLHIFDLSREFKKEVVDYFIKEYSLGRTPNPCPVCNRFIKFGLFLKKARNLGADLIATGHYVRLKKIDGKFHLFTAKDKKRDQSYFLYTLNQNQLKYVIFPLGDYLKKYVRQMAQQLSLSVDFNESRGLCFLGQNNFREFLKKNIKSKEGPIKDVQSGKILGRHLGLPFYTIGQREAINIGGTGPYYVVDLDFKKNILWVVHRSQESLLYKRELIVKEVNWILGNALPDNSIIRARIRYGHPSNLVTIKKIQKYKYHLLFKLPQRAITPGQAAVFYDILGKELLGGGIIC